MRSRLRVGCEFGAPMSPTIEQKRVSHIEQVPSGFPLLMVGVPALWLTLAWSATVVTP